TPAAARSYSHGPRRQRSLGRKTMRHVLIPFAALALLTIGGGAMAAEESTAPAAANSEAAAPDVPKSEVAKEPELTPEEKAEKEARKACKKQICDILATRDPNGADVACDITKTWREASITKMLGGKIDWPWGKAVCQSKLVLKRDALAKAMIAPKYEVK